MGIVLFYWTAINLSSFKLKRKRGDMKKQYIIYDGRAISDTDDAMVMEVCDTLEEAVESAPNYGEGCCIYSYEVKGNKLINEQFEEMV